MHAVSQVPTMCCMYVMSYPSAPQKAVSLTMPCAVAQVAGGPRAHLVTKTGRESKEVTLREGTY